MGMISETQHWLTAQEFKKILEAAKDSGNQDVISFCKGYVWPNYTSHMDEAYSPYDEQLEGFWND